MTSRGLLISTFALVLLISCGPLESEGKLYHGYSVLKTSVLTDKDVQELRTLQLTEPQYDFWREAVPGYHSLIMSSPADREQLEALLDHFHIGFSVHIEDVQEFIEYAEGQKGEKIAADARYNLDWDDYYSHDDINEFIDELAATYSFVDSFSIGSTFEGRDQRVISMTRAGAGKPNYWIEAGFHAREWITAAVTTYLIRELVENDAAHPQYLDNLNIHVMPLGNPDGYEFTRNETGDRLWRKTRSVHNGSVCFGVDPNRNFDYHWGESGSTDIPCTDIYRGPQPFSEPETRNMRDFYLSLDPLPVVSHAIHSPFEVWAYPFGYAHGTFPNNVDELIDVANQSVEALYNVHGIPFEVKCLSDIYLHAGTSSDWYSSQGSRFVYTTELRDQGRTAVIT